MSTVIAVKSSVALRESLKEFAELECRGIGKQAAFYLEAIVGAAKRQPSLRQRLLPEILPTGPSMPWHDNIVVENDTYDYLFHWAGSLGVKMSAFVRLVLYNGIRWDEKVCQKRILDKEEVIGKIVATVFADRPPTIH